MSRLPVFIDPQLIWIRNFPSDFLASEIQQFIELCLSNSTARVVSITKNNAALVHFSTTTEPQHYIKELHQRPVKDRLLTVTYAKKLSANISTNSQSPTSTVHAKQRFSEFLTKLYGTDSIFEQPPPPYLRYEYPKANRDILDAISIALETTPKLYTQVLHLMNRMNLEPPFIVGSKNLQWASTVRIEDKCMVDLREASTQTESDQRNVNLIGTDESELESDVELNIKPKTRKRHKTEKISNSKRIRSILHSVQNGYANQPSIQTTNVIEDTFEMNKGILDRSIVIRAPTQLISNEDSTIKVVGRIPVIENAAEQALRAADSANTATDDILQVRISLDEMNSHPLFQNYQTGEPTNKLYIKNLAKNVEEDDLRNIYSRFAEAGQSIDIRVMKTGRMKGQAFVCFNDPYMDDETGYSPVEKALRETNGLVVKGKVMVVMFGKK